MTIQENNHQVMHKLTKGLCMED